MKVLYAKSYIVATTSATLCGKQSQCLFMLNAAPRKGGHPPVFQHAPLMHDAIRAAALFSSSFVCVAAKATRRRAAPFATVG